MNTINEIRRGGGQISQRTLVAIVVVALIIGAAVWLLTREPEPEPVPAPEPAPVAEPTRPLERVAPAESAAQRGDSAREFIDELRSREGDVDFAAAYERARQFQAEDRLADAQLLYFFAARGGHGPAAFDLATFHDPNLHSPASSLMDEPDPFQAYRWYKAAEADGHDGAGERLAALRAWAEQAADEGNAEAERLLLQWE